jgi:glycosyltransferase involved in cell wall biosynthesis
MLRPPMHIVQLAAYGGPYAGAFVPMLTRVTAEAHARGHTMEAVFSPVARGRPWLPELEAAGLPVSFAGSDRRADLRRAIPAPDGPLVLHSHFTEFDVPALQVARRRGAAVIWHLHTHLDPALRIRLANAVKFGLLGRRVDRIVCVAPHIAAMARARLAPRSRTVTMLNAVDVERFPLRTPERTAAARERLGVAPGARVVLHFGRLWRQKGGDLLLEAVRRLAADGVPVLVLTVSGGDAARANADALGLSEHVRPIEPSDDVSALYTAADAFVSSSRAEGMPYSLLEAAATGTAVVATDIPGQREIGADVPGVRVAALDGVALAGAIRAVLERDPGAAAAEGAAAREWLTRNADVRAGARALVDLYEEVARRPTS